MPETIHDFLTRLLDGLLLPVNHSPLLALVLVALLLGSLAALVISHLTSKGRLHSITQQLQAELLALRLFADQPGNLLRSLPRIVGLLVLRIGCLLPAILLLLPIGLVMANQLEMRFARRPLEAGESALVTLRLEEDVSVDFDSIKLEVDRPLAVKHGPLQDREEGAIYWEIAVGTDSSVQTGKEPPVLRIEIAEESFTIPVHIVSAEEPLPGVIDCWSNRFAARLLFGCPRSWPDDLPVRDIAIEYPPRTLTIAGQAVSWLTPFLVCFLLGYFLTRRFGK